MPKQKKVTPQEFNWSDLSPIQAKATKKLMEMRGIPPLAYPDKFTAIAVINDISLPITTLLKVTENEVYQAISSNNNDKTVLHHQLLEAKETAERLQSRIDNALLAFYEDR